MKFVAYNFTQGEGIEVESVEEHKYPKPIVSGLVSVSREVEYKLVKPIPSHWNATDNVKILEEN